MCHWTRPWVLRPALGPDFGGYLAADRDSVALAQAEQQEQALKILLGTIPASGPGIKITITA